MNTIMNSVGKIPENEVYRSEQLGFGERLLKGQRFPNFQNGKWKGENGSDGVFVMLYKINEKFFFSFSLLFLFLQDLSCKA